MNGQDCKKQGSEVFQNVALLRSHDSTHDNHDDSDREGAPEVVESARVSPIPSMITRKPSAVRLNGVPGIFSSAQRKWCGTSQAHTVPNTVQSQKGLAIARAHRMATERSPMPPTRHGSSLPRRLSARRRSNQSRINEIFVMASSALASMVPSAAGKKLAAPSPFPVLRSSRRQSKPLQDAGRAGIVFRRSSAPMRVSNSVRVRTI